MFRQDWIGHRMGEHRTENVEDYLKTIYQLTVVFQRASTNQISETLHVTPASVTGMIQKLSEQDPPLVEYQKHRGVALTPDGEKIALEVLRHHRLMETFLQRILGYSWDDVHRDADRLEHAISEEFEEKVAEMLGYPTHDPHGEPIPTRELQLPPQLTLRLSDLKVGQQAILRQVGNTEPAFLRYLASIGLAPQAQLKVMDISPFDFNLRIRVGNRLETLVLGPRVTQHIFVEVL
jgi:DtxR family Mn-dependent transcriptional regulator